MYFGMKKAFSSINVVSEEESEEETPVNFQIEYRVGPFCAGSVLRTWVGLKSEQSIFDSSMVSMTVSSTRFQSEPRKKLIVTQDSSLWWINSSRKYYSLDWSARCDQRIYRGTQAIRYHNGRDRIVFKVTPFSSLSPNIYGFRAEQRVGPLKNSYKTITYCIKK